MDYICREKDTDIIIEQEAKRMNDEIIDRLIAYRKHLRMTQQDIADVTGIQRANIARMESKKSISSVENLKKYAKSVGYELYFELVRKNVGTRKLPLPIGCADYCSVSRDYCYVDKTLFIKELLDEGAKVSLFTRPRRFGKTLNMDMLRVFFEKTDHDTAVYFMDKKIWKCGEIYREQQGKYPVISLTFKDVKFASWDDNVMYLKFIFATEFNRHPELFDSDRCNEFERNYFARVASGEATEMELVQSLMMLTRMLAKHHDVPAIIIIDEYDCPIQQGYMNGYYDKSVAFVRSLFSGGFKDNPYLFHGFLTGILRVAKESIFSGLNNIKVNSILDNKYSQYFGFTPDEVRNMAKYYNALDKYDEICKWYDGYRFGESHIFNPWSVIGYFNENCVPKPFWVSTSSNDIIGNILENATDEIKQQLHHLLQGETVLASIDTSVIYPKINESLDSVYSFLLVTGYLKILDTLDVGEGEYAYQVAIPNLEVKSIYKKEILSKFTEIIPHSTSKAIQNAIYRNNLAELKEELQKLLLETVSYNDVTNESFYHGFLLGLCAMLDREYIVSSNREAGEGRFDIQLMPRKTNFPGVLIEIKHGKNCTKDSLVKLSRNALQQIKERSYITEMKRQGIREIVEYGVAFCGKKVEIAMDVICENASFL